MRKLTPFGVNWHGILPAVAKLIKQWRPAKLKTEKQYQKSLEDFLRKCNPDAKIEREYRHAGTTTDVYVEYTTFAGRVFGTTLEVLIEMKRNLLKKAEYDRLVGQIEGLRPGENRVIVVLCGATDQRFRDRLIEHYADQISDDVLAVIRVKDK